MRIRRLDMDERPAVSVPTQAYGFQPSPATDAAIAALRDHQSYYTEHVTLVAEDEGVAVAEVSAVPMRQNVRGSVYPMAGVAGVTSLPLVRRRGYVRALLVELLGQMRDEGHAVSALYPFRPSFYERFGYVGMPKPRTVRFSPADLDFLQRAELDGEVIWERIGSGFDAYRDFTHRLLPCRHGFAVLPERHARQVGDNDQDWLASAVVNGTVAGAVPYRITGHGRELVTDDLLVTDPLSRGLLLQFLARHVDHVTEIVTTVPPDEIPELWATDLTVLVEMRTSFPTAPAPMARVLALDALDGMPVGPGRITVEIVDDPFVSGVYELDGMAGALEVIAGGAASPEVTLTVAGLSGLVYGVLDPGDVVIRGFGQVPADAIPELANMFPRALPYFFSRF